ncbi:class I SAM-dependent methyltransferase [Paenibacillus thiaminolyticus]|uniref:Class I SAM-dependent methyltransferase n=1 Tax=Paenibacillus thiaminolyticus TaxID=49283 RepID=A0AAP9DR67_PANTH|nr:class I SAM-dependent methyltransferase [Paenibacillus thiaminolyticus]MCY9538012.1 class I SAM-dependent methyltransferase [Paenibacillus thiaminolyticus]MCY9604922.1 class I SAM-dependent methyltransferase [Paenibacillus thiaminolyticus]MCY9610657.1 class I SAM-dependent methyltransferase [Paenibacillus thiaminolyticus]MCY9615986.1 class I SAM-dependent methyltransferase [Paenibacillus thiaminolyticus]MCY9622392.1 class I SAM-dependent methyltransferase [Paenibacillus thiaminolyticus]
MFSYYSNLCTEVYDLTKPVGHSVGGDIEYYLDRLQSCSGRILEAAVGSGRMLIPLLEAELVVDGIDYSPAMLASCHQRCEERNVKPMLYEGELQNFTLPHKYDAIIIPTGSFCLIDNREDSINALKCFYEHLNPGGRVIIDLILPERMEIGTISTSTFTFSSGDVITVEDKLVEFNMIHQYSVSYLKYEKWREGALIQSELQRFALRWYGNEEFKLVLESIGFSDIVCSTDYVYGKQPTDGSQIFTFEAVRK